MIEDQVSEILQSLPKRICDVLQPWAESSPDRPALVEDAGTWTYRQLSSAVAAARVWLFESGVRPGDRVMIVSENSRAFVAVLLGLASLDAWPVLVNARLAAVEVDRIREHCGARRLIYTSSVSPHAREHAHRHGAVILSVPEIGSIALGPLDQAVAPEPIDSDIADRVAAVIYTSGTTGHPKGVMLSHKSIVVNHRTVASTGRLKERSQTVLMLPLSHSFGVLMMNVCYLTGCTATILPRFDAKQVLETIHTHRVTRFAVVPTMLVHLINFPDREEYDTSCLESVNSGGAILPNEVRVQFERLYRCKVLDGYGLSECAPTASAWTG